MLSNESGIIGRPSCGWSSCSFWMCSFASRTPSEVRTLTAAPSSPALASALCSLFTGLKEPYPRTTLGMLHSSLNIPFLNDSMFWRTLLNNSPASHVIGRTNLGRINRPLRTPFFLVRASKMCAMTMGAFWVTLTFSHTKVIYKSTWRNLCHVLMQCFTEQNT